MVSLSNGVSHSKGKRRKVSAIRLFPPHCGPKALDVVVSANIKFSQASGCSALRVPKDHVFHHVKQDISESCGENDPWVNNQLPKQGGLVSVKQEVPDGCRENHPMVNPLLKEDCVVSVKREVFDGCEENDLQVKKALSAEGHYLTPMKFLIWD